MFTTAKNSSRPPLTRKSCTSFPLFPPLLPRVVGPGILGAPRCAGGRCPRKISWVANPSLRNKPTPGERETSLITPGFGIEFRLPLRVLVFRAIPRGFRSGNRPRIRGGVCTRRGIKSWNTLSRWVGSAFEIESARLKNAPTDREGAFFLSFLFLLVFFSLLRLIRCIFYRVREIIFTLDNLQYRFLFFFLIR